MQTHVQTQSYTIWPKYRGSVAMKMKVDNDPQLKLKARYVFLYLCYNKNKSQV